MRPNFVVVVCTNIPSLPLLLVSLAPSAVVKRGPGDSSSAYLDSTVIVMLNLPHQPLKVFGTPSFTTATTSPSTTPSASSTVRLSTNSRPVLSPAASREVR